MNGNQQVMAFLDHNLQHNLYSGSIKMSIIGKKFGKCYTKHNEQILEHNRHGHSMHTSYGLHLRPIVQMLVFNYNICIGTITSVPVYVCDITYVHS